MSSFGISGTNAHVILEAPDLVAEPGPERGVDRGVVGAPVPWIVTAKSSAALAAQAGRLRDFVGGRPDLDLGDVGWSLATTRARLDHRGIVLADDRDGYLAALDALAGDRDAPGLVRGVSGGGKVAFVFSGQGAQWEGMAVGLWDASAVFAEEMRRCGDALAEFVDWSLEGVLRGDPGAPPLERVDVVQPVLFAVMVSLAGLWRSFGVEPSAVVGHSQGEIAAACVAGVLSLRDAARVVTSRSQALLEELAGRGGMVVGLVAGR